MHVFDRSILRSIFFLSLLLAPLTTLGAESGTLRGTVTDPLGAVVVSATVELLDGTSVAATTTTDSTGSYLLDRKSVV